jgi:hypothetical protein
MWELLQEKIRSWTTCKAVVAQWKSKLLWLTDCLLELLALGDRGPNGRTLSIDVAASPAPTTTSSSSTNIRGQISTERAVTDDTSPSTPTTPTTAAGISSSAPSTPTGSRTPRLIKQPSKLEAVVESDDHAQIDASPPPNDAALKSTAMPPSSTITTITVPVVSLTSVPTTPTPVTAHAPSSSPTSPAMLTRATTLPATLSTATSGGGAPAKGTNITMSSSIVISRPASGTVAVAPTSAATLPPSAQSVIAGGPGDGKTEPSSSSGEVKASSSSSSSSSSSTVSTKVSATADVLSRYATFNDLFRVWDHFIRLIGDPNVITTPPLRHQAMLGIIDPLHLFLSAFDRPLTESTERASMTPSIHSLISLC